MIETRDHVATLRFSAPPHNFLHLESLTEIADALAKLDGDSDVRAVVFTTEGRVFCAGADFSGSGQEEVTRENVGQFYAQAARIFTARKPVVAAIQGAAIGAGLGLALAADFRVATSEARFSANFVRLGFHPGFGMSLSLEAVVGHQAASLLLLTGRRIGGDEAMKIGLVDQLAPSADLYAAAHDLAAEIAGNAPLAVQDTRATLRAALAGSIRQVTDHEASIQGRHRKSADFLEGLQAATERRNPVFIGS
ncbi:enoyl-CoA hydratase/isomerase family protein [Sphingomonas panacis]|nr:enoyl-CoA hydratase/isomerase family protein [Sphingomonas panacis]